MSPPEIENSDPTGARTAGLLVKYAAPAAVLAAPPDDVFDVPKVAANYADRGYRYPIHTAAAAWTSAAAALDAGGVDPETEGRIKAAMTYHRLPPGEWDRLAAAAARPAQAGGRYALPAERKYPIDTPDQVRAAAAYFDKYAAAMPAAVRETYADNLLAAGAGVLGPDVRGRLEAETGRGLPHPEWRTEFDKRAGLARDPELKGVLERTRDAVAAGLDPRGPFADAPKLASLLRALDRQAGWDFPDPIGNLVGVTPSEAAVRLASAVKAADDHWYRAEDLDAIPDADFGAVFGTGPVVTRAAKAAALRDPDRCATVRALLDSHAVAPVGRPRPRTDFAALAALAGTA